MKIIYYCFNLCFSIMYSISLLCVYWHLYFLFFGEPYLELLPILSLVSYQHVQILCMLFTSHLCGKPFFQNVVCLQLYFYRVKFINSLCIYDFYFSHHAHNGNVWCGVSIFNRITWSLLLPLYYLSTGLAGCTIIIYFHH